MPQHWQERNGVVHCEGINAGDYLLCGLAPEGERGDTPVSETFAKIDCGQCVAIIEFCRRVRPGEYASTKRAQR